MKNSNYKIVLRNIKKDEVEFYDYDLIDKDHPLMQLDELLSKYSTKEQFIREYLKKENIEDYDIYIIYKTNSKENNQFKFLDCHFGLNISNNNMKQKMINNIVDKGLKNYEFINFIRENDRGLYKKFDHYEKKIFMYNKIKKRFDSIKNGDFESANIYTKKIKILLNNDYLTLRKLVDLSYRFTHKISQYGKYDYDRKYFSYKFTNERNNSVVPGQISFDIENLNNQNNKSDIKEQTTHDLDVTSVYFELLNSDVNFYDSYLKNSNLSEKLLNYTNRYINAICISLEDELESNKNRQIIIHELEKGKNMKEIIEVIKLYYDDNKKHIK